MVFACPRGGAVWLGERDRARLVIADHEKDGEAGAAGAQEKSVEPGLGAGAKSVGIGHREHEELGLGGIAQGDVLPTRVVELVEAPEHRVHVAAALLRAENGGGVREGFAGGGDVTVGNEHASGGALRGGCGVPEARAQGAKRTGKGRLAASFHRRT